MRSLTTGSSGLQRRPHHPRDVLGSVSGCDQRLGAVLEVDDVDVVKDRPEPGADVRTAGLPREHGVERSGQPFACVLFPDPSGPSRAM